MKKARKIIKVGEKYFAKTLAFGNQKRKTIHVSKKHKKPKHNENHDSESD